MACWSYSVFWTWPQISGDLPNNFRLLCHLIYMSDKHQTRELATLYNLTQFHCYILLSQARGSQFHPGQRLEKCPTVFVPGRAWLGRRIWRNLGGIWVRPRYQGSLPPSTEQKLLKYQTAAKGSCRQSKVCSPASFSFLQQKSHYNGSFHGQKELFRLVLEENRPCLNTGDANDKLKIDKIKFLSVSISAKNRQIKKWRIIEFREQRWWTAIEFRPQLSSYRARNETCFD